MTIKDQALAAFEASLQELVNNAKEHLITTVLTGSDGKPLVDTSTITVAAEDYRSNRFVFTDGNIHLGVLSTVDGWEIYVVEDKDGWTKKSSQITSLVDLGKYFKSLDTETA